MLCVREFFATGLYGSVEVVAPRPLAAAHAQLRVRLAARADGALPVKGLGRVL